MSKIPYYIKRQNGPNSYNNNYGNYTNYINSYKKPYFKGRQKINNNQISNYFDNRKNNYYYNNTFYSFNNSFSNLNENKNFGHPSCFSKK